MGGDTLISVIAPIRDDGDILEEFVADVFVVLRAHYANFEVVLVDDASSDRTAEVADRLLGTYPCLRLIRLSRRHGNEVAITAGLDSAIGDYVVVMRPASDPPAEIPAMVGAAASGRGIVLGTSRRHAGRGPVVSLCRGAFYWMARRLLDRTPPPDATGFCVLSRPLLNAVVRTKSKHRHLAFLSCTAGFAMTSHPYQQIARSPRRSLRPLREAIDEAIGVFVGNSAFPLRVASYLGAFAAALNLLYVAYILVVNLVKQRVAEGWTTLSLQSSAMFFLMFVNLVIISEYVAHILRESQDRPLYHVLEERASTVRADEPGRRNVA